MKFLKGLTRWFHFNKEPTTIESGKPIQEVPAERQQLVTRRNLLFGLGATAIVAAMPEIPFGRVWSFPSPTVRIPVYGSAGGLSTEWVHADPRRIDFLHSQSLALQLEKVRDQLPLLYENNDAMFGLISRFRPEPVSARAVRLPIEYGKSYGDSFGADYGRGTATTYDFIEDDFLEDVDRYLPAGDDGSHGPFHSGNVLPAGDIPGALNLEIPVPNLKTEAGKVSRLVDRYGNALAEKVDRTVVKPLRDELESVCDLVNNA